MVIFVRFKVAGYAYRVSHSYLYGISLVCVFHLFYIHEILLCYATEQIVYSCKRRQENTLKLKVYKELKNLWKGSVANSGKSFTLLLFRFTTPAQNTSRKRRTYWAHPAQCFSVIMRERPRAPKRGPTTRVLGRAPLAAARPAPLARPYPYRTLP